MIRRIEVFIFLAAVVLAVGPVFGQAEFEEPFMVKVGGEMLNMGGLGYASPYICDFNGDGKNDLLVGYWADRELNGEALKDAGLVKVFYNVGTNRVPRYEKGVHIEAGGVVAAVPPG
jgi:hypothetical protein